MVWHSSAAATIRDARLIWSIHSDYSEPCRGQLRKTCKGRDLRVFGEVYSSPHLNLHLLFYGSSSSNCRYGVGGRPPTAALLLSCNQMLMQSAFKMQFDSHRLRWWACAIKLVWILFVGHHLMEEASRSWRKEKHSFGLWLANCISHHSVVVVHRWMHKSGECIRIVRVAMRKYLPT